MGYPKFVYQITNRVLAAKNLNVLKKEHIKSAPYDPATNGCPGRVVRAFKNTFRKMEGSGSSNEKLNTSLFTYRITPRSTAGISLAGLSMNRKSNSKLSIIKPGAELNKDIFLPNVARHLQVGDEVWILNFSIDNLAFSISIGNK